MGFAELQPGSESSGLLVELKVGDLLRLPLSITQEDVSNELLLVASPVPKQIDEGFEGPFVQACATAGR